MTDFESAVILATVRNDPGIYRRVLAAAVGVLLGRPYQDEGVILTFMDSLQAQGLTQRHMTPGGYAYEITEAGRERLRQIRERLQPGLNLINMSY